VNTANPPVVAARLRLTYVYYLALAAASALVGRQNPLAPLLDHVVACIALALTFSACLGRIWCSAFIGGFKNSRLITEGPYSLSRHPLYSFSWIGAIGLGLTTRSFALTLVTALFFAMMLNRAAKREEQFLSDTYPYRFAKYAHATSRWWPRLRSYHAPASLSIKPVILRKAFLDAGAFILLYLLIDTLRLLREAGFLPTFCNIP